MKKGSFYFCPTIARTERIFSMMAILLSAFFIFASAFSVCAQTEGIGVANDTPIRFVKNLPATCKPTVSGQVLVYKSSAPRGLYYCSGVNTWTQIGTGGGGGGVITLANTYGNSLSSAIDTIGSTPTTLIIDANTTLTVHRDVPSTLKFEQRNGAKITISGAGSLAYLGNPIRGDETAFFAVNSHPDFLWPNLGQLNFATDTINYTNHGFQTGQQLLYTVSKLGDGTGAEWVSMSGLVDDTVYYAIAVDADHLKLATTNANALAGTAIDLSLGPGTGTFLLHHTPIYWGGTDSPATVSSELIDTGDNSENARANVLTRALSGHGVWINIYPTSPTGAQRYVDEALFLQPGHKIRMMKGGGDGIHHNIHDGTTGSQDHWPYSPFSIQFYLLSNSEMTSEKGAIVQQSNVDYVNGIVAIGIRARHSSIHDNYFRQDRQETKTGSASPIAINGGSHNHILDNYAEGLKCYVFSINPIRPGVDDPKHSSVERNTVKDTLTQVFFIGGGDDILFKENTLDVKDLILHISVSRISTSTATIGVPNGTLTSAKNLGWTYSSSGDTGSTVTAVGANDSYSAGYQAITLSAPSTLTNTQAASFDNIVACSPFDVEPNGSTVLKNIRIEDTTFDTRGLNNGAGSIVSFIRVNPAGVQDPQNIFIRGTRIFATYPTENPNDGRYVAVDVIGVDNFEISGTQAEGISNAAPLIQVVYSRRGRIFNNTGKNGASGVFLKDTQDTEVKGTKYLPTPDYAYGTTTNGNISEAAFVHDGLNAGQSTLSYWIGSYKTTSTLAFAAGTPGQGVDGGYVFKHFLQSKVYINEIEYTITGINNYDFATYPTTEITVSPNFSSTPTLHLTIPNTDISAATNTIHAVGHGYVTGAGIAYTTGTLTGPIGNLYGGFFVIRVDADNFKVAWSYDDAINNVPLDIISVPATNHEFYTTAVGFSTGNDFHDNNTTGLQIRLASPHSTTLVRKGTVTIDPASINGTTYSTQTFTLMGARVGDTLTLNPPSTGLTAGLVVQHSFVSAPDTITEVLYNSTGAPINEPSGTWTYSLNR